MEVLVGRLWNKRIGQYSGLLVMHMTRIRLSIERYKAYCQMVMKDELKSIKVSRNYRKIDKPRFVKTIDRSIVAQITPLEKVIRTAKQPF